MRIARPKPAARGENIVPLINIVFLLLIFFLLAGTIAPRPDFELEPVETILQPLADAPAGALFVSASGEMSRQGQRLEASGLKSAVAENKNTGEDQPFKVVIDRRLKAEKLLELIQALTFAGAGKVRLITRRGDEG